MQHDEAEQTKSAKFEPMQSHPLRHQSKPTSSTVDIFFWVKAVNCSKPEVKLDVTFFSPTATELL